MRKRDLVILSLLFLMFPPLGGVLAQQVDFIEKKLIIQGKCVLDTIMPDKVNIGLRIVSTEETASQAYSARRRNLVSGYQPCVTSRHLLLKVPAGSAW